jgi:membrane-bound serine protease (ClpP class)
VGLADRIASMPVPVVVWVGPVPARASGGAMLLMLASSLASVAPGSQTGPLDPVDLLHPGTAVPGLDARIDAWLLARGRTADRAHEDESLDAAQALRYHFAESAYPSVLDLLNGIDGKTVPTASGPVVLHTHIASTEAEAQAGQGVSIRFGELGPIRRVEHAVASPSMIYVLLVFGLACLAFETTQPGFGFAGFAGLFLLALAAYGITVVPPTWLGLGVLLAGLAALALDVRLRRFGVLTWGGTAVFALGSVLVYGRVADPIRISPWLIAGATIAGFLFFGFGLTVAIASRDRIVSTQRGLIGLVGEARGKMAPDGPVFVKGSLWRGRSLGEPIATGTRVRVRGVDGLVLKVEPETEPSAPNG